MAEIKNPKINPEVKDIHTYVSKQTYEKVDQMLIEGIIPTKTEYIADLIENDLKERAK